MTTETDPHAGVHAEKLSVAAGSFDCEDRGRSFRRSIRQSRLTRRTRCAISFWIIAFAGATVGTVGFFALHPRNAANGASVRDAMISFDIDCMWSHLDAHNGKLDTIADCEVTHRDRGHLLSNAFAKSLLAFMASPLVHTRPLLASNRHVAPPAASLRQGMMMRHGAEPKNSPFSMSDPQHLRFGPSAFRSASMTRADVHMVEGADKPDDASILEVNGLNADVAGVNILKGVNLKVKKGEVHAIMGPNGCGKSTFSKVLMGHPSYEVTGGSAVFKGDDLLDIPAEERAQQGVFLAFQYPVEVPGVSNTDFLRLAVNKRRVAQGLEEYDPIEFMGVLAEKMATVSMAMDFMSRDVNTGFSGGEKKRNEILQMALLEPDLAILDETDSGLDIDALKQVAAGVNTYHSKENAVVLITHYQRLLDYIKPDFVHVMHKGQIVRSGGPELALELERDGYAFLEEAKA